jgi:hypothetical protein
MSTSAEETTFSKCEVHVHQFARETYTLRWTGPPQCIK